VTRKASVSEPKGIGKIVILKIGGSVLTGAKAFRRVALFLERRSQLRPSEKLVVVVSAQKLMTDSLERRARRIVQNPGVRALNLLWSTGELRSVALLVLHLEALRISSVGLNVHETGLHFSSSQEAGPARLRLTEGPLQSALMKHAIVVVPGFLATRSDGAIISVGRGGSDLSAVLLAIGLGASRCELVKDVSGYFEDDPHENARAAHLPWLSFKDALRMADRGCDLVQPRAILAASESNLPLMIRSMDERAPVSVISLYSKSGSEKVPDEPVSAKV
jgi:aspartate kinase